MVADQGVTGETDAIERVELRRIALPLVAPFRTSFGTRTTRDVLLVRVDDPDAEGWGECVADGGARSTPREYVDGAAGRHRAATSLPRLVAARRTVDADRRRRTLLAPVKGHPMAKAAVETAVLDAELRAAGVSFGDLPRRGRATGSPCGVSVGIMDSIDELLDAVGGYLDEGYRGSSSRSSRAGTSSRCAPCGSASATTCLLQVDANTAYTLADARQLAQLDPFDLLLIEQPLPGGRRPRPRGAGPAARARRCASTSRSPPPGPPPTRSRSGACAIVNIKAGPGRRLPRGAPRARRLRGQRRPGVVRRHARDRAGPRRQRRPGGAARTSPCPATRRPRPLLRERHHGAVRAGRRSPPVPTGPGCRS